MKTKQAAKDTLDAFKGCLIGGAAGDALGYPVEFISDKQIFNQYGPEGIQEYKLSNGEALISDDTQMTLFTATGLICGTIEDAEHTVNKLSEHTVNKPSEHIVDKLSVHVRHAYQDWYRLQSMRYTEKKNKRHSWLVDVPEMWALRAPGNTCMYALGGATQGTVAKPVNHSKGCGGIMRVAPIGLYLNRNPKENDQILQVDQLGAEASAITHGHELGYMPAAVFVHIINRIVYGGCTRGDTLEDIVLESMDSIRQLYPNGEWTEFLCDLIEKAITLSYNEADDLDNLRKLGEGWVAEETLAVSIYCCLKYQNDFSKALCVSVNHKGDSDSTGAVTGNILGALIGYEKIPMKWKKNLECFDVIMEIAEDLYLSDPMSEIYENNDPEWVQKYVKCKRVKRL